MADIFTVAHCFKNNVTVIFRKKQPLCRVARYVNGRHFKTIIIIIIINITKKVSFRCF